MWNELLICGFIAIGLIIIRRGWGRENEGRFPPGPFAWPVIGHLHLFSLEMVPKHVEFASTEVSKKWGHIVGLRLGQQRAVVVSSPELAKEVLLTHDKVFAGRPPHEFASIMLFGSSIIFSSHGPQWRRHRKICMLHLFTAKRLLQLQYLRQEEVSTLLHSIHALSCSGSSPVDLAACVRLMSSRLIMRLILSRPSMLVGHENLQQLIRESEQELGPTMGELIPSLSWLDFFRKRRMRRIHARLDKVYTEILMERKQSVCLYDDLLDALLSQEEALTLNEIKSILHDMIAAGIQTTAVTLEWAMGELLRNPQCLERLQREIDAELKGEKKQVTDAEVANMSYLKCVVKEACRLHPVIPVVGHMSMEECKVQGYTIPAKTLMVVNLLAIGRDEQVWPHANEFMPERFEGKDLDVKGHHFQLLPFGSGRRSCLGLPLALSILEVTLANLVTCFHWELATHTSLNMDEKNGILSTKATPLLVVPKPRLLFSKLLTNT